MSWAATTTGSWGHADPSPSRPALAMEQTHHGHGKMHMSAPDLAKAASTVDAELTAGGFSQAHVLSLPSSASSDQRFPSSCSWQGIRKVE